MGKRWRIFPHDEHRVAEVQRSSGVAPVVAQLLVCRGITAPAEVRRFLEAKLSGLRPPEQLPGIEKATELLREAIDAGRRVIVYGDYDADGMTATAILFRTLKSLGANVGYYVPNRLEDGYGLSDEALRTLSRRGAEVVISVDCGITSVGPAETARELGLQLIVTDHHAMGPQLPEAAAVVHPAHPDFDYPFHGLCGAGVALKLSWSLCKSVSGSERVGDRLKRLLLSAVGIAAIGTVADVVPLVDENRILVRHGLSCLKHDPPLGLKFLMRITETDTKSELTAEDIAFSIAPRLNAAGRLGQAQLGVELLTTDSPDRAEALAEYLHELNSSRSSLERSIYLAAHKQAKSEFDPHGDPALVLSGRGWHAGVIGIVAGRLAEKYHRPVVVLSQDELGVKPATGSARSACGLNLHQALAACSEYLVSHGGHAAAAGLAIEDGRIEHFRAAFCDHVASQTLAADLEAEVLIDAEAPLSQLTYKTVAAIESLAPFGHGNPRPVLCATGARLADTPKTMGGGDRHLSLKVEHHGVTMRAVGFGHGEHAETLSQVDGPLDLAYRPIVNEFRGRRSVELHLVDWRDGNAHSGD